MPATPLTKVVYVAAATVVTTAALVTLATLSPLQRIFSGNDEERPPIIVRGGSVTFETVADGTIPKKPWKQVKKDWQPSHPQGIPVTKFTVEIEPASDSCPALELTHELLVIYTDENNISSSFFITTKARDGKKDDPAPTIVTNRPLTPDDPNNPMKLSYGKDQNGSISGVKFLGVGGYVDCKGPVSTVRLGQDN